MKKLTNQQKPFVATKRVKSTYLSLFAFSLPFLFTGTSQVMAEPLQNINAEKVRSPYEIIEQADDSSWRSIDDQNTLYIELQDGRVVVELSPKFAPVHVKNIKALAREGFYDGLSIYRFVEGFVAQGGDQSGKKTSKNAKLTLTSERFTTSTLPFTSLGYKDAFAEETGFVDGFAAARNSAGEHWMVHCPTAFAMARGNSVDSGGTEFYVVLGHAPRYLDRNVTVFGRVISGMEHIQSLKRQSTQDNIIKTVNVAADLPVKERDALQIMKTDSKDFAETITSRANRPEEWFMEQAKYVDVCGVTIPVRRAK